MALATFIVAGVAILVGRDTTPRAAASEPLNASAERGRKLATMLCFACHADPTTGVLSGREVHDVPRDLACRAFAPNITQHPSRGIGGWSDSELAYFFRTGVNNHDRVVPPWMPRLTHMADADLGDLIAFLRSDDPAVHASSIAQPPVQLTRRGRLASRFVFRKSHYPLSPVIAPPIDDQVAYGRYVVQGKAHCYVCHSATFTGLDDRHPEYSQGYLGGGNVLNDLNGARVLAPNITADAATGIGLWTEDQFIRAVGEGFHPQGHALRYPMLPYKELSNDELRAAFAYLRSVPRIHNPRRTPPPADGLTAAAGNDRSALLERGAALYTRYACRSCHGSNGAGMGDLTQANRRYPRDEELKAWIRHPSNIKPGTKMPTFDGVIKPDEYDPLVAFVRELARQANR